MIEQRRHESLQDWTRAGLSIVIILLVAGVLWALFVREVPISNRDAVMLVLGALLLRLSDVYAFNFNSTSESAKKNSIIEKQADTMHAAQAALAPLPDANVIPVAPGDSVTVKASEE